VSGLPGIFVGQLTALEHDIRGAAAFPGFKSTQKGSLSACPLSVKRCISIPRQRGLLSAASPIATIHGLGSFVRDVPEGDKTVSPRHVRSTLPIVGIRRSVRTVRFEWCRLALDKDYKPRLLILLSRPIPKGCLYSIFRCGAGSGGRGIRSHRRCGARARRSKPRSSRRVRRRAEGPDGRCGRRFVRNLRPEWPGPQR
jgi:hypothetical protein